MRWQVLHSKVRRSNPRSPGEIRPKPILCLQVGHIGRSTVENEVRISRHPSARICIAETRGLSGVRLSVKFNLAAPQHLSNGRYRARLDRAAGNPGTKVGVQLQSNHARIKSMNRKAEEASEGQRKTVVILSDRSREIIRLFEERQRVRQQVEHPLAQVSRMENTWPVVSKMLVILLARLR